MPGPASHVPVGDGLLTADDEAIKFLGEIAAAMITVHKKTTGNPPDKMYSLVHEILKMLDSAKPSEPSFSFQLATALKSETPLHKLCEHFRR